MTSMELLEHILLLTDCILLCRKVVAVHVLKEVLAHLKPGADLSGVALFTNARQIIGL